jgi:hypothetical protein
VKSTAGAISTSPDILAAVSAAPRRRNSRASSSAIQPPIDDPMTTCGPAQCAAKTARLSSSQRPMVPASNGPADSPCPE